MSEVGRGEGADKILELVDKIKGGEMDMKKVKINSNNCHI